jgi:threonine/homoserine/homoserine lactone efflux protein
MQLTSLTGFSSELLISYILFSIVTSVTPGPNNTIATVTGVYHGFKAELPHIVGVIIGFSSMMFLTCFGVSQVLQRFPQILHVLSIGACGYLLWMSYQLCRSTKLSDRDVPQPLTLWQAVLFQYMNPKAWTMALGAASGWLTKSSQPLATIALMCVISAIASTVSLSSWAFVGSKIRYWLQIGTRLKWFNRIMAFGLASSTLSLLWL